MLVGATAVVSTLGGFGNEEQMKRINGEANVTAVDAAKEFGKYCTTGVIYQFACICIDLFWGEIDVITCLN